MRREQAFYQHNRIFWRYFVSYTLIVLLTLALGALTYARTLDMVQKDAINTRRSLLEQSKDLIDLRLRETESEVVRISLDSRVRSLMRVRKPLGGPDFELVRKLLEQFPGSNLTNTFIYDSLIYFRNSDILVSNRYASSRIDLLYNEYFRYESIDFASWKESVIGQYQYGIYTKAENVITRADKIRLISYIQSFPIGSYSTYLGSIIILIDEKMIHEHLSELNLDDRGWCFIQDKDGNLITQYGNMKEPVDMDTLQDQGSATLTIDGVDMTYVYTTSDYNGWKYAAVFPTRAAMDKVAYIRSIFLYTSLAVILLGACAAWFLAYRNYRPVRRLVRTAQSLWDGFSSQARDEYDYLTETLNQLAGNNSDLEAAMADQIPLLRLSFYERLLNNSFTTAEEIDHYQSHLNLDLSGQTYAVLLIRINGYNGEISKEILNELTVKRLLILGRLNQLIEMTYAVHNLEHDKIALILAWPDEAAVSRDKAHAAAERVLNDLNTCHDFQVNLAIGSICSSLLDVGDSCREALKAISLVGPEQETRIIDANSLPSCSGRYVFTLEQQARLVSLTRTGSLDHVLALLNQIYQNNFSCDMLSADDFNQLIAEMRGIAIKIYQSMEDHDGQTEFEHHLAQIAASQSAEAYRESVNAMFCFLHPKVQQQKSDYNQLLVNKIKAYILDPANRQHLYLGSIAAHFDLTEKYLSSFFKRMTGENISLTIEKTSMDHALALLKENRLPVKEIALAVGYNNVNTFYKAFKRVHGISPSDYKRRHMLSGLD